MHSLPARRAVVSARQTRRVVSVRPIADVWLVCEVDSPNAEVYDRRRDAVLRAIHILNRSGGGRMRIRARNGSRTLELDICPASVPSAVRETFAGERRPADARSGT